MGRSGKIRYDVIQHKRSGLVHATCFGKTLCGRYTTPMPGQASAWHPSNGGNGRDVSCYRCLASLGPLGS